MRIVTCFVSATLLACGVDSPTQPDGPEILPNLKVPPKPENGIQVITPIFRGIAPSSDNEVCTWTDAVFDQTTDVRKSQAFQTEPGGHHVVAYYTTIKQPPGTQRICQDTDMATFRLLAGGGEGIVNEAPGNLVYRIPAGAQLVLNHHYLNTTDQTLDGQSGVNLEFAGPGSYVPSGNLAIVDTSLDVQPGAYRTTIHCAFDRDFKLWYLIPHMHQWGVNEKVDLTRGGVTAHLFDTTWDPACAFHPCVATSRLRPIRVPKRLSARRLLRRVCSIRRTCRIAPATSHARRRTPCSDRWFWFSPLKGNGELRGRRHRNRDGRSELTRASPSRA
jgi:hypothetical protein